MDCAQAIRAVELSVKFGEPLREPPPGEAASASPSKRVFSEWSRRSNEAVEDESKAAYRDYGRFERRGEGGNW